MPIVPALTGPRATPLAGDATAPGLAFVGLRLTDGSLVLELERDGEAARSRLEPASGFSPADGVLVQHDLLTEPLAGTCRPAPRCGPATTRARRSCSALLVREPDCVDGSAPLPRPGPTSRYRLDLLHIGAEGASHAAE